VRIDPSLHSSALENIVEQALDRQESRASIMM